MKGHGNWKKVLTKLGVIFVAVSVALALVVPVLASGAEFPTRPITIWIGWAPGGSTDVLARAAAPAAEKILGQPVVIENKPGGTGALAMGLLKNAKPDGYTLAACTDTPFTRIPHTVGVKYNSLEDFTYITELGRSRIGVVVRSDSPFKKFQDLIDFARKNPGQLTHGTPGVANTTHLAMEKIAQIEKVRMQHIFFQGSAPTIAATLGGHVMCASTVAVGWIPHVKAGTLRPLLIYDPPEGIEQMPEIPTLKRLGYGFEVPIFEVMAAPKGLPKPIADKLIAAFAEAMKSPQFQNVAREQETILSGKILSGDDLHKTIETQYNSYGTLIKELGLGKK
jgi:tripartite-type tricarboxylate transporter receptor subunit TctC